jgi:hypothetical protein
VLDGEGLRRRDDGEGAVWFEAGGFFLYAPEGRVEGVGAFPSVYEVPFG